MNKLKDNLLFKIGVAVLLGFVIGLVSSEGLMKILVTVKYVASQIISFCVPLIILGFIAPSIAKMKSNASKMLGTMVTLCYASSIGAALFAMFAGYAIIPTFNIDASTEALRSLPAVGLPLSLPPLMPVMTALVTAIFLGLSTVWTKSETMDKLLMEANEMVLSIVKKVIIPILPVFILTTFAGLAYEGSITKHFPVFVKVIAIVLVGHFMWLALLYTIGGIVSKKNAFKLFKKMLPAYFTAVGTMSSAATLPVALKCAQESEVLDEEVSGFAVSLGATTHLCGSVLTEVFFIMVVSQILYGTLPGMGAMVTFIFLLGVFAVGAPGIPGGTVMASLGIIVSILGFDSTGTGLMLTIFALQDSFGTACNVTGDGALALILDGIKNRGEKKAQLKTV